MKKAGSFRLTITNHDQDSLLTNTMLSNLPSIKLESIIRKSTLPKTLAYLSLISVILISGLLYFSYLQTQNKHQNYIAQFTQLFDARLKGIQQELSNLAQNDLIINSLVDIEFQNRSLPVFIRSLKLSVNPVSIGFTDYKGNIVTANSPSIGEELKVFGSWKEQVLDNKQRYTEFKNGSIFIAEPVMYADQAEAALIVFIDDIASLLGTLPSSTHDILLINSNNEVLFSTKPTLFKINTVISNQRFANYLVHKQPFRDWRVISLETYWDSYRSLIPLLLFLFIGLIGVLIATIYGIRLASKQASKAVQDLQQTLEVKALGALDDINQSQNQTASAQLSTNRSNGPLVDEFIEIQRKFDGLLYDLNSTALSRNTLAGVVDSLDEVLLVLDLNHHIVLKNSPLETLVERLNLTLPQDIFRLIPEYFLTEAVDNNTEDCTYLPEHFPSLTGLIDFKWRRNAFKNDQGQQIGYILSGNDITADRAIRAELLIKNKAIDETNTPIIIAEAKDNRLPIIYVNRAFEELTGYSKDYAIGKTCSYLQGKNTEPEKVEQIRQALRNAEPLSITITNYKKDGSEYKNQLTLSPLFDQYGLLTHFIGLQEDVSERERTNKLIQEAKDKAEESAMLKSAFLASMSHEIRTPMNGILGMLNIVKQTELNNTQKQQILLAEQSAASLLVIINDILDFSKIEAGKLHLEPIEIDLFKETHNIVQSLHASALKKGIQLLINTTELQSPYMIGDPTRIKQVLTNLVSNAIKFTDHGYVSIKLKSTHLDDNKIKLEVDVTDQGIGIAKQNQERIFETFTQADNSTTRQYGGTGLGLPISRQLCRMMDGDISVQSEPGMGSTFSFHILLSASDYAFSQPDFYARKPIYIFDSNVKHALLIQEQLKVWGFTSTLIDSMPALVSTLERSANCITFIDETALNRLDKKRAQAFKDALERLPESIFIINTEEFNPYVNQSLFGSEPKHVFRHLHQPITAYQLLECAKDEPSLSAINSPTNASHAEICRNKHILLVEDNHINQIVASNILKNLGAIITIANNGLEALSTLEEEPKRFDLILMDCQMPEMDGYEATRQIRQKKAGEFYASIPIIALTANALKGDKEKCLDAGMDDHLSKPIDIDELKEVLQHWFGNQNPQTDLSDPTAIAALALDQSIDQDSITADDIEKLQSEPLSTSLKTGEAENKNAKKPGEDEEAVVWDEAEMLHRISDNKHLAGQLVEVFCMDVEDIYLELNQAVETKDLKAIGFTAHTLKGIASNISGIKLARQCLKLEKDAKDGIEENLDVFFKPLAEMIKELKQELEAAALKWQE